MNNYYNVFLKNVKNSFCFYKNKNFFLIVDRGRYLPAIKASLIGQFINKKYSLNPILLSDLGKKNFVLKVYRFFGLRNKITGFKYILVIFEPLILLKAVLTTLYGIYIIKKNNFYWFINNFKIHSISFGDLIYDTYIRNDLSFLHPKIDLKFINILFKSSFRIFKILRIFRKFKIKKVLVATTTYSFNDGITTRVSLAKKISVLEVQGLNYIETHTNDKIIYGPHNIKKKGLKKNVKNLRLSKKYLNNFVEKRFNGEINTNYTQGSDLKTSNKKKKQYSRKELINKIGFKKDQFEKIILIPSHAFSDAPHGLGTKLIFCDYYDHLKKTIDYINKLSNPKILWLIKPNPNSHFFGEKNIVKNLVKKYNSNNIRITPKNISASNLVKICDNAITARGTMALEFACYGKRSIIAGAATYSGLGFTIESKNKKEYFNKISKILKIKKLSSKETLLAQKTLFYIEKNTSGPLNRNPIKKKSNIIENISLGFDELELKSKKNQNIVFGKNILKILEKINLNKNLIYRKIKKDI